MSERMEALKRIPLGIVYGIIIYFISIIAEIIWTLQFFHVLIKGERHKGYAEFYNQYVGFVYRVNRYMGFVTNERPGILELKEVEPVDLKE